MTDFLLRHFLADDSDRSAVGNLAGIVGMLCNLSLAIGKILIGFFAGSIAVLADGVNNLTDGVSSLVTLLGFRMARRPADQDHPFGHGRYEYLAGLGISVMILVLGVELAKSALQKILAPEPVAISPLMFWALLASVVVKLWMMCFYRKLGRRIDSGVLFAAAADSRNDVVATSAVLVSCGIQAVSGRNLDGIIGLAVAGFVLWSGIQSVRGALPPLMGTQPEEDLQEKISDVVLSHEKVLGVHDLLIHDYGPDRRYASVHAEISAREDMLQAHDLMEDIEEDVRRDLNVELVIHCDPVATDDPRWRELLAAVCEAASGLDSRLSVHDLRLTELEGSTQLVFDLAVPYDMEQTDEEIRSSMTQRLQGKADNYPIVMHIDRVC